jgi:hypothetical protein
MAQTGVVRSLCRTASACEVLVVYPLVFWTEVFLLFAPEARGPVYVELERRLSAWLPRS